MSTPGQSTAEDLDRRAGLTTAQAAVNILEVASDDRNNQNSDGAVDKIATPTAPLPFSEIRISIVTRDTQGTDRPSALHEKNIERPARAVASPSALPESSQPRQAGAIRASHVAAAEIERIQNLPRRPLPEQNDLPELSSANRLAQSQSPFFRLPLEIRQVIYGHVFSFSADTHVTVRCRVGHFSDPRFTILGTCYLAFAEAEKVFYSINDFEWARNISPPYLLGKVQSKYRVAITSWRFDGALMSSTHMVTKLTILQALPNLRKIVIRLAHLMSNLGVIRWSESSNTLWTYLSSFRKLRELKILLPPPDNYGIVSDEEKSEALTNFVKILKQGSRIVGQCHVSLHRAE